MIKSFRKNHVSLFLIILFFLYGVLVKEFDEALSSLIVMTLLIHAIIFLFVKKGLNSLLLLIGSILILGISSVTYFYKHPELFTTTSLIIIIMYSISLFIVWYLLYDQKVKNEMKEQLQFKVESLEKYSNDNYIYKMKEFQDRSQLITSACSRRKEEGYYVVITDQTRRNRKAQQALHRTIGDVLVHCTRIHYDIVGEKDAQSYIVLLQNINKKELNTVLARFYKELGTIVSIKDLKLSVEIHDIYDYQLDVEETE